MDVPLYGELSIIGYHGPTKLNNLRSRHQAKIVLHKRPEPNGVQPGPARHVASPGASCAVRSHATHSISYTLSRTETVVVEYISDPKMDMFQIGRSTNNHIDFVVSESRPSELTRVPKLPDAVATRPEEAHGGRSKRNGAHLDSAVSRFACRIHIERDPPYTARIYAAGFDAERNIVLGELAVKWRRKGRMDGLTTNGVMILRTEPNGDNSQPSDAATVGSGSSKHVKWREVSICGSLYEMRDRRCVPKSENWVDENNILQDKTLIDLCGVTLFWRSAVGLTQSANSEDLNIMVHGLNLAKIQCPVTYTTLRLPPVNVSQAPASRHRLSSSALAEVNANHVSRTDPYVYLECGHVHGWHTWHAKADKNHTNRTCPLCIRSSSFVPLRMGLEPAFYIDRGLATHCFNPCGHMASEQTVKFWCSVPLPNNQDLDLQPRCPFCGIVIRSEPVQLRFHGEADTETLVQQLNDLLTSAACAESLAVAFKSEDG